MRFVVSHWKEGANSRRQTTKATAEEAEAYGEAILKSRLADHYLVDRVETIARRSRG